MPVKDSPMNPNAARLAEPAEGHRAVVEWVIAADHARCIPLSAHSAEKKQKFLSSLAETSRFTAEIATTEIDN